MAETKTAPATEEVKDVVVEKTETTEETKESQEN